MADEFLTTRWSVVLSAAGDDAGAGRALEQLCRDSWRPLFAYARRRGCTQEDAEDAVQGFLASLLARKSLAHVSEGRGRFRSFLLSGMRNYLSDAHSRAYAEKRGGHCAHFSLDVDAAERGYLEVAADSPTPEQAYERAWAMEVMARARAALEEECIAGGKGDVFHALFGADGAGDMQARAEAAARLGLAETGFRTLAMRLRRRWRDLIRAELAQTVTTKSGLDEEMAALRAAL